MTREEQIKQYCADNGFPYGACSSISSVKASVATEAIRWADEHPNGSQIKWQTGMPQESGVYLITTANAYVDVFYFELTSKTHKDIFDRTVIAWCNTSDIRPCQLTKDKEKQP